MEHEPGGLPTLMCACASLRRASRAVTQMYDDSLRETGLRSTQFTLLQFLSRRGPLLQGELAELLVIDTTTLSRTLRTLEKSGWIRARPGDDRRERHWNLTPGGKRKLERARPAWEAAQARLRASLGSSRWDSLLAELAQIADVQS